MKASDTLLEAIRQFEGLRLTAYRCPAGTLTVGYGHTGRGLRQGMTITKQKAEEYLAKDVAAAEKDLSTLNLPTLSQSQYDALVDFIFNLGISQTKTSTLVRYIRQGKTDLLIVREFMRWVYSNGKQLPGLVARRQWEAQQWCAHPVYKSEKDFKWYIDKTK